MNKKIYLILSVTALVGILGTVVYIEGSSNEVIKTPTLPKSSIQTTQNNSKEDTSNKVLTEEERKIEEEKKLEEEKKKKEKEEEEINIIYSKTPLYAQDSYYSSDDSYLNYPYISDISDSLDTLENEVKDMINSLNSNLITKLEAETNKNMNKVTETITEVQKVVLESQLAAEEALKKAEEALKQMQESVNKPNDVDSEDNSNKATIRGTDISGVYSSDIVNGMPVGSGTFTNISNNDIIWVYTGSFLNGTMAHGTMIYADGTTIDGDFMEGKLNGSCDIITSSFHYKGTVEQGIINGKGTMDFITGESYTGEFKNGSYNGYGEYIKNSGEVIKGDFLNGNLYRKEVER